MASTGSPGGHASLQPRHVGVDDLLVARDGEQQRDVDVHAACREFLDRGDPGRGGRDLDHHVGPRETTPEIERLLDGGVSVVGKVGRALERHETVAPTAGLIDGTQQVGGAADVLERDREEPLLRGAAPGDAPSSSS